MALNKTKVRIRKVTRQDGRGKRETLPCRSGKEYSYGGCDEVSLKSYPTRNIHWLDIINMLNI